MTRIAFARIPIPLLVSIAVSLSAFGSRTAHAQAASPDVITFFGVAQPQGPGTGSYLRMRHPLYLLNLCRQLKAGAADRKTVEGFVGRNALDALLAMDLDALYDHLTGPHDPAQPASTHTMWHQILTDGETAPLPRPDGPDTLDFGNIARGGASETLHVTVPGDGTIEAQLPADSPFRILSIRTDKGIITERWVQAPAGVRSLAGLLPDVGRAPELLRREAPWMLPVSAGQDVEIDVGVDAAAVPPGGVSSTISLGDPFQNMWHQDVSMSAQPALPSGGIFVALTKSRTFFDVLRPLGLPTPATFLVTVTASTPFPATLVAGTVQALSAPPGASMPILQFSVAPQGTTTIVIPVSIAPFSTAWQTQSLQPFSVSVSYHTVGPPFASQTDVLHFGFTMYDTFQTWDVSGKAGGVDCSQSVMLTSDGTLDRSGLCTNDNFYSATVVAIGTLVVPDVVKDVYPLGFFDQKARSSTVSWGYGKTNFLFVRTQPLIMSWTKQ